ncbi:Ectonucleotide pyrophosphatase/phosphodiesterase family member 3 [Acipenser ruthenus]|uniref:Ectonucleotide pyrophosphatase/phosphodiesterase family member 3 n=1 Tax=Acipenser ruthenus TaxID=7906 RepID=A0A444UE45_ACIRT|nr:Ectonucleotide pyrophosphatase/phosphodiesterase family member 3 [Acipenser ruthenus]
MGAGKGLFQAQSKRSIIILNNGNAPEPGVVKNQFKTNSKTNYLDKHKNVCQGESQWVEDPCEEITAPQCPVSFSKQPVILISLDGFQAEYLRTWSKIIPVIEKLKTCGTHSPYMQASFPTMTFPNHYTIVTGMYPESHGVVDNNMYDPVFKASFSLGNSEKSNPRWYLGQPDNEVAGGKNDNEGAGGKDDNEGAGGKDDNEGAGGKDDNEGAGGKDDNEGAGGKDDNEGAGEKDDNEGAGEKDDNEGAGEKDDNEGAGEKGDNEGAGEKDDNEGAGGKIWLTAMYQELKAGTFFWPGSDVKVNGSFPTIYEDYNGKVPFEERVYTVLKWLSLPEKERPHFYTLYLEEPDKSGHNSGPVSGGVIEALQGVDVIMGQLMNGLKQLNLHKCVNILLVADHEHTPKRYHYANSRRIEDVTLLVDAQWLVARNKESYTYCNGGTHGYDNDYSSMQAIFIAYGPKFLYKTEVGPFANVEVYNLMCDLLEVHPAPNNGTHGSMNHLLRKPWFNPSFPTEMTEPGSCPLITLTPGDELNCSCLAMGTIENNERLNLTAAEVTASGQRHMPFGRPRVLRSNEDYCLLYQLGYVSAYNKKTVMPTWTSFTVEKPTDLDPLPDIIPNCLRADVRVPANQSLRCDFIADDTNIAEAFLYPPNLNKTQDEQYDALLMSNVVPMYPAFKRIWNYFHNVLLKKYASQYNGVNVVSGPAFDFNYDGRFDTPDQFRRFIKGTNILIPTHYFAVLTSCDNGSQPVLDCKKALQTVSFIMPHRQDNSEVCNNQDDESKWVENLLWFHQNKVTDVEWITGLDFYQDSNRPVPDLLRMKTRPTSAIHRVV